MNIKTLCFAASSIASVVAGASMASADGGTGTGISYGYADFYGVPRLGQETVVGTGCGGDGSIGTTIPDGYWRGHVTSADPDTAIELDLTCVYRGDVDPDLINRWRAEHPGELEPWTPDGFVANNNSRTRTVPTASTFVMHGTQFGADGSCRFDQPATPYELGEDSWVRIVNGQAEWVVSGCASPGEIGAWTPAPQPQPTTQPQPGSGFAFPYGEFWDVPQLGTEPVRGTGCGADGSLGDSMPDGLWYGDIASTGTGALEFDVACMYHGAVATQKCNDFAAANPEYGSPPCWGEGADALFFENNNLRTRTVPLAASYVAADAVFAGPDTGTGACIPPADPTVVNEMNTGMGVWLSIENGQAQYSLRECGHD